MTQAVHLGAMLALAALWLAAGVLADGLPDAPSARALRQRAGTVLAFSAGGLAALVALVLIPSPEWAPVAPGTVDPHRLALLLPLAPAALAAGFTMRRLARVWAGASAFTSAPGVPVPPSLRAGGAHPLLAIPLQATGLAAAAGGALSAGWLRSADTGAVGVLVTGLTLAVLALGVRHALRHSRLAEGAVTVRRAAAAVPH